jgi:hypothetical protein
VDQVEREPQADRAGHRKAQPRHQHHGNEEHRSRRAAGEHHAALAQAADEKPGAEGVEQAAQAVPGKHQTDHGVGNVKAQLQEGAKEGKRPEEEERFRDANCEQPAHRHQRPERPIDRERAKRAARRCRPCPAGAHEKHRSDTQKHRPEKAEGQAPADPVGEPAADQRTEHLAQHRAGDEMGDGGLALLHGHHVPYVGHAQRHGCRREHSGG